VFLAIFFAFRVFLDGQGGNDAPAHFFGATCWPEMTFGDYSQIKISTAYNVRSQPGPVTITSVLPYYCSATITERCGQRCSPPEVPAKATIRPIRVLRLYVVPRCRIRSTLLP
jgi:hypothetical protein